MVTLQEVKDSAWYYCFQCKKFVDSWHKDQEEFKKHDVKKLIPNYLFERYIEQLSDNNK